MIGTLGFAPPEQYQGQVDPRSDIYSLGATLHYVLTGRDPEKFPPFSFPPVRELRPGVSSNLAGAIDAALAYEMDGRPPRRPGIPRHDALRARARGATRGRVSSTSGTGGLSQLDQPFEYDEPPIAYAKPRSRLRPRDRSGDFPDGAGRAPRSARPTFIRARNCSCGSGSSRCSTDCRGSMRSCWPRRARIRSNFQQMTLALSTREGIALAAPQAQFNDTELTNARYLKWTASFKNLLAGLEGRDEKVEARFFDPNGLQIASSDTNVFVGPAQKTADFSGVALMPTMTDKPAGTYKVALYSDDKMLHAGRLRRQPGHEREECGGGSRCGGRGGGERRGAQARRGSAQARDDRRAARQAVAAAQYQFSQHHQDRNRAVGRDRLFRRVEGAVRRMAGQLREPALQAGAGPVSRRCGVYRAGRPHARQRQRLSAGFRRA